MKASELIKIIKNKCGDKDPEIKFVSYEWNDNLTNMDYEERWFDRVSMKKGVLNIAISR